MYVPMCVEVNVWRGSGECQVSSIMLCLVPLKQSLPSEPSGRVVGI